MGLGRVSELVFFFEGWCLPWVIDVMSAVTNPSPIADGRSILVVFGVSIVVML